MADVVSEGLALEWLYLEHFGFSKAPPQTDGDVVRNMALALVAAASGDGELSAEERRWILGYITAKGYPASVIAEVAQLSSVDVGSLPELMNLGILQKSGRILIYDAIRASSVDAYSRGERAAVRKAAAMLGIDEATIVAIEQLVVEEHALKARRIKLLMPNGHPNLDPKYQT